MATAKQLYDRLVDLASDHPGFIRVTLDDGREIDVYGLDPQHEPYEDSMSHGRIDITVELTAEVFHEHDDFPSDVGFILQRRRRRDDYTDPEMRLYETPDEYTLVGTVTAVENIESTDD